MNWDFCDAVWICTTNKNIKLDKYKKTLQILQDDLNIPKKKIYTNVMKHGSHETPELSCSANHLEVWNRASLKKHKIVFIVEDDLSIAPFANFDKADYAIQDFLKSKTSWDILYLGCFAQKIETGMKRYTIRKAICWALHAYVVTDKFMKKYNNFTPKQIREGCYEMEKKISDSDRYFQKNFTKTPGIDSWVVLLSGMGEINSYSIYPHILSQNSRRGTDVYSVTVEPMIAITGKAWNGLALFFILILFILGIVLMGIIGLSKLPSMKHKKK